MSNPKMEQMEAILKKSLITIKKLEAELAALKEGASDAIAIIGMGCRMPGNIHSPEDLWQLLVNKQDAVSEIPSDRWDRDSTYDEDPLAAGKTNTKFGAFLSEDVRQFDAGFFGISPREAKSIDPIQRILLELTQETLERAGIAPDSLKGSNTGVYLGIGNSDYAQARLRSGDLNNVDVYDTTGIPLATASGRLSYQYDLQGPSFTVDAACSSTLVALHLAAEALRRNECDLAITGAANLLLTPELFVGLTKLGSLSPDGKCRAFDENGNGYVRGEGCGIVLLKRLKEAQRDGDNILAVLKGSAIVHDGLSNGYTAPNPDAQSKVIHAAIKDAAVEPSSIDFVESHGVGNKFTDALEIQALEEAYGKKSGKLYVGSVKPNLGHMEAAIGMAMLAKVIGAIQHRKVPPNINFETPNTDIEWNDISVEVPTEVKEWNREEPLRAAIHLTSYNGTNTHMIIEEWKGEEAEVEQEGITWPAVAINLSAKDLEALQQLVSTYANNSFEEDIKDIAYTLASGRSALDHRLSVYATGLEDLQEALKAYQAEGKHKLVKTNDADLIRNRQLAFLFTGQGSQYPGMCQTLYETNPVFKQEVERCAHILTEHLNRSIIDVIYGEDVESIHQTKYTQPALFVVEYAMARLWQHWGLQPAAVAGHSVGEYVALTIAGVLKLEDALALIAARGRMIQSLPTGIGGMAAVLSGEEIVRPYLGSNEVDIAAVNSPKSLTISGKKEEIDAVVAKLKEDKIKAILLTVSHAFHSYQMDDILKDFEAEVAKVQMHEPVIPVISNVTGKEVMLSELTPEYFSQHIRGSVRFGDDVKFLDEELGIDIFLEVGPNPTLTGLAKQSITKPSALLLSSAKKDQDERKILLESLQQLYLSGVTIDWETFYGGQHRKKLELPTYPWQRKEYWYDPVQGLGSSTASSTNDNSAEAPVAQTTINKDNLMELMQGIATRILGLEPGSQLDIYRSIREQGFDSMMSGEFLVTLEKYVNTKLEMSLIHVYGDLNSLYNYIVKEIMGEDDSITMSDVMFDTGGNGFADEFGLEDTSDWHSIKETDGKLMRWFKKMDRKLSVKE